MTIVPREWEQRKVSPAAVRGLASFSHLHVALMIMGLACIVVGVVLLARGEFLGLAAVCFGLGYVARALAPRTER